MSMNLNQGRVVDPILTDIARGYTHPERVGSVLFPRVEVLQRGGKIIQFGKESFRLLNTRRAPGSATKSVSFGYSGDPYLLVQDALDVPLPRELMEEAQAVPGIDLGKRAVNLAMQSLTLGLEYEQAKLATDPNSYGPNNKMVLTGNSQWTNPESDPLGDIDAAKEVVRRGAGVDPNRMVISKPIYNQLKLHPKIVERFKYTTSDSITTKMLANLFDLDELAVGKAVAMAQAASEDSPFEDVWGDSVVLAYVPANPKGMEEPSFGYTYALKNHPFVEKPTWENTVKSWVYGVTYERAPVLAGVEAGFLIQGAIGDVTP